MSVLDVAKKLNKSWKEDVLTDGNFTKEIKRIKTKSLGMSWALHGGLPLGQVVVFSGMQHSGKSISAAQVMADYQRQFPDKVCIWVDAENTLLTQGEFIQRMTGLNYDKEHFLRYDCSGRSCEEIFSDLIELQKEPDIGCITIDSCPVLISKDELDNEFEKDAGMRGSIAKPLQKFLKQMIMYLPKRDNILLLINQVRVDGKSFTGAPLYREPCGSAIQFLSSICVRFGTRNYVQGDKTDLAANKGEEADGFRLKFAVTKNRMGAMNRGGGFQTYRYATGLDYVTDMLEIAMKFGYINKPNAMTYELINLETGELYSDANGQPLKFVGKQKLIDYLNANPDFKESYVEMLSKYISESEMKVDLLDETQMEEILQQEAIVSFENNTEAKELDVKNDEEDN